MAEGKKESHGEKEERKKEGDRDPYPSSYTPINVRKEGNLVSKTREIEKKKDPRTI